MPILSMFFGIIIRMYYDDHDPAHFHAEHQGRKAVFDFRGNILKGDLRSRTATKLVREWADLHASDLLEDWELAKQSKELKKIPPLD
jgi:hypothetical protein